MIIYTKNLGYFFTPYRKVRDLAVAYSNKLVWQLLARLKPKTSKHISTLLAQNIQYNMKMKIRKMYVLLLLNRQLAYDLKIQCQLCFDGLIRGTGMLVVGVLKRGILLSIVEALGLRVNVPCGTLAFATCFLSIPCGLGPLSQNTFGFTQVDASEGQWHAKAQIRPLLY